jgi:20S proteasome alpha/beta subunit
MTLILGLRGKDGVVLAADSRGTIGDPRGLTAIDDTQTKLFQLGKYCGLAVAGSSELAAKCVDELRPILAKGGHQYADAIMQEARVLARKNYDDWFSKFKLEERPAVMFLLCGYERGAGQNAAVVPRTYMLTSQLDFAPQLMPNGNGLAGVPQYAIYLLNRLYNPDMTVSHLPRLAAYLIGETATQDPKVGGPIRIATITPQDGFKLLGQAEVDEIVKRNNEQNEQLRQFFFERGYDADS